jgi:hypothetical protein
MLDSSIFGKREVILRLESKEEAIEMRFPADLDVYDYMDQWDKFLLATGFQRDSINSGHIESCDEEIFPDCAEDYDPDVYDKITEAEEIE